MNSQSRSALLGTFLLLFGLLLAPLPADGQIVPLRLSDLRARVGDVDAVQLSPDGSHALYLADQDQARVVELYAVRLDGGPAIKLSSPTDGERPVWEAKFSPDGARVVFLAGGTAPTSGGLFSVSIDGGTPIRLNRLADRAVTVADFAISADGQHVVYQSNELSGRQELFSVPLGGGTITNLSSEAPGPDGLVKRFAISPDGRQVVYTALRLTEGIDDLFVVAIEGGVARRLNPQEPFRRHVDSFAFALGSSSVVYRVQLPASAAGSPTSALYGVALTGGTSRLLSGPLPDGETHQSFTVTPDGRSVVFRAGAFGGFEQGLYSAEVATGELVTLAEPARAVSLDFAISADSRFAVYRGLAEGRDALFRVPVGGGDSRRLSGVGQPEAFVTDFRISPDGRQVVFLHATEDNARALWTVPVEGGTVTRLDTPGLPRSLVERFWINPNGLSVIYLAPQADGQQFDLFHVPIAGGLVTPILTGGLGSVPDPGVGRPGGSPDHGVTFTEDGLATIFFARDPSTSVEELWVATGFPERLPLRPPASLNTATGVRFYKGKE